MPSDEQLVRAAQLYYQEDVDQLGVAQRMGISRTTVSRWLKAARDRQIVRISIHRPAVIQEGLSAELEARFGLKQARVAEGGADYETALQNVGSAAAQLVMDLVSPYQVVGVSWGHTLFHVVQELPEHPVEGTAIVQMCGSVGSSNPEVDGPDLARRLAEKLGATYRYVHAPTIVESAELRDQLVSQPQIRQTLEALANADLFLFGVGTLVGDESSLVRSGHLDAAERDRLRAEGAVGHLLGRMIDRDGVELQRSSRRVVAIPLEYLRRSARSILVAASSIKAPCILAAVRGGYADTIVIDQAAAMEVIRLADNGR